MAGGVLAVLVRRVWVSGSLNERRIPDPEGANFLVRRFQAFALSLCDQDARAGRLLRKAGQTHHHGCEHSISKETRYYCSLHARPTIAMAPFCLPAWCLADSSCPVPVPVPAPAPAPKGPGRALQSLSPAWRESLSQSHLAFLLGRALGWDALLATF